MDLSFGTGSKTNLQRMLSRITVHYDQVYRLALLQDITPWAIDRSGGTRVAGKQALCHLLLQTQLTEDRRDDRRVVRDPIKCRSVRAVRHCIEGHEKRNRVRRLREDWLGRYRNECSVVHVMVRHLEVKRL